MNSYRAAAIAALMLLPLHGALADAPKISLAWTTSVHSMIETAPTVADLLGTGTSEVIAAAHEELVAVDGSGKEMWRFRTKARYMTYPAVLVRPGKPALIYAADNGGLLSCVDGKGAEVWHATLKAGASWSSAVVCDLHHDGQYAVLQGDESGTLTAFRAEDGKVLWKAQLKGALCSPAVGDMDADGNLEIAVTTNAGELSLLDAGGNIKWTRAFSAACDTWQTSAPILLQSSKGPKIAVGASDGRVSCYLPDGKLQWMHRTHGYIASSLSAGDMDGDGKADIFAITGTGMVYRFGEDGDIRWKLDMQGRTIGAGALIDLDHSGHLSYILSTQSGHMLAFDSNAHILYEYQFPARTINMTPAFAHLQPGSSTLDMVVTGGETGNVYCFHTDASVNGPWPAYRGGATKAGAWLPKSIKPRAAAPAITEIEQRATVVSAVPMAVSGVTPTGQVVTGSPVRFSINAPAGTPLPVKLIAMCQRPDGSRQDAMTPVYGLDGELELPVEALTAGKYCLEWYAQDASGKRLSEGTRTITVRPFEADRAVTSGAIQRVMQAEKLCESVLPLTSSALTHIREDLSKHASEIEILRADVPASEAKLFAETPALIKEAERAQRLAIAAERATSAGPGTSLIAFEANTWESGGVDELVPTSNGAGPLKLTRRVAQGCTDGTSIKLLNITNRPLTVQVSVEASKNGPVCTLLHSLATPTKQGSMAYDALVNVDDSGTITIQPMQTGEVWLSTRLHNLQAGNYSIKAHFAALNGAGVLDGPRNSLDVSPPDTVADIQYTVLPIQLANSGAFRMCCWATCGPAEIADLLAHGNNVFTVIGPTPVYSAAGVLTGFDFTKMDQTLDALHGQDVIVLVEGIPALKPAGGTEAYQAEIKLYTDALRAHMKTQGLDTQHFALYPYDEPGGAGWTAINGLADFGRAIKAADPAIQIYIDGGGDLPMFQKVAPFIDIWCPPIGLPADGSAEAALIRGTGKTLWTYECGYGYTSAMDANLKVTNNFAEYRTAALFALRWGATGIGFWSYNIGQNAWQRTATDYPLVYPGRTGPITSRRWEAVRQGIEEARLLMAVKARAAGPDASPAFKARVAALTEKALPALVDRSHQEVLVGLGRSAFGRSQNEHKYNLFMKELLDCAEAATAK